jgi:hypothetical protein
MRSDKNVRDVRICAARHSVSEMAAKHGLTWGGDWKPGSRDNMHFEWTGAKTKQQPQTKTANVHGSPL